MNDNSNKDNDKDKTGTCDIWDTDNNSENWEPESMTIFVIWQSIRTLDSIRNSCDVFQTSKKFFIELMKNCQNRSLYTTRSDQFTKMRAFYKRQPFFIKKNYPLLFMKNSMPTNGGL